MSEYYGRYHLIDLEKQIELFDSSTLIDCWNRIEGKRKLICDDTGHIVAGSADVLKAMIATHTDHINAFGMTMSHNL